MNLIPGSVRITGSGAIGSSGMAQRVFSISLISGGTASVLSLYDGTSASGNLQISFTGTASTGAVVNFAGGMRFPNGCFASVDGNISSATIVFCREF